jgi:hypothetical protein
MRVPISRTPKQHSIRSAHSRTVAGFVRFRGCALIALSLLASNDAYAQTTNYVLGMTNLSVGPATGTYSVVLGVTPSTGQWTATANDPWLHLDTADQSGEGSTNVIFNYDANPGGTRSGNLTIGDQTLAITQAGSTYVSAPPPTVLVSLPPFTGPWGLAVDVAGNVYTVAYDNVIEWSAANNTVTNLISSGLNNPLAVAVDGTGNVYIADSGNDAIKKWSAADSNVTTLVSSGLPDGPNTLAGDAAGNIYTSTWFYNYVYEWSASNGNLTTLISTDLGASLEPVLNFCRIDS